MVEAAVMEEEVASRHEKLCFCCFSVVFGRMREVPVQRMRTAESTPLWTTIPMMSHDRRKSDGSSKTGAVFFNVETVFGTLMRRIGGAESLYELCSAVRRYNTLYRVDNDRFNSCIQICIH